MNNSEPHYKEPNLSHKTLKVIIQEHIKLKHSSKMKFCGGGEQHGQKVESISQSINKYNWRIKKF